MTKENLIEKITIHGLPFFIGKDIKKITAVSPSRWHGCFYAIEFGKNLKIGYTKDISEHLKSIARTNNRYSGTKIGRYLFSEYHTNYKENGRILEKYFHQTGRGSCVKISLEYFIENLPQLSLRNEQDFLEEDSKRRSNLLMNAILSA
nr:MAG TPA: hypothetical protein [Caudoviricetes sp.]